MTILLTVLGVAALFGLLMESMNSRLEINNLRYDLDCAKSDIGDNRKKIWDLREREAIALAHFNLEYSAQPRKVTLVEKK